MPDKHYDVIVVGRSLGALVTAALLARRDFTVLVVGQERLPAAYSFEGRGLRRRTFTMLCAKSPAWTRVLGELAHTQAWRRQVVPVSPMLQALLPGKRFEVQPDAALFAREAAREFPAAHRLVMDLYADFARVTAAADVAYGRDAIWPPETFLERRETGRLASKLPYAQSEPHADLLAEFPRDHQYHRIVHDTVRFASDLATPVCAFAAARLHGSWTRGLLEIPGGEDALETMLLERIGANGGRHLAQERVARIEVRRGAVSGIVIDGDDAPTGGGFIVSDLTGEELAALAGGQGIRKKAQREWPRLRTPVSRFVVSLVLREQGVSAPFGRELFLFGNNRAEHCIHLQRVDSEQPGEVLLVAELLLAERDTLVAKDVRQHVVDRLRRELPFLDRHLLLVDSVHDGLPLWQYREDGSYDMVERSRLQGASTRAEPMERQFDVDPPGYLGLSGEPIRGPIERSLLVGPSVLPGLGQEGRVLAGCGAARLVTASDKRKARMRREKWTKLEIS